MKTDSSSSPLHRLWTIPGVLLFAGSLAVMPRASAQTASGPQQQTSGPQQQTSGPQQTSSDPALQDRLAADYTQKVQDLVTAAEARYRSGVQNYNANQLDAARADFDAAVDMYLSSGMDLKEEQIADEFDRLLSDINSLELVALKQGNGFSPKLEEAPVEAAGDVTFPPDPVLVAKVTAELKTTASDMPLVINDYVAGWLSAYTNRPGLHAHLKSSIERAGKYKELIQRILREQGVPQDLIYQAVTESGFQPQAMNRRSGAAGMWQFMAANDYLAHNAYYDERFDPEKSTIAYAKYMKKLYGMFGDWYLAMAAYDWGPGRVEHVISKTGYADYWEIYRRANLPAETKAYIPSVIAAIIMAKNPEQYGLKDLVPDAPILMDTVHTDYAISLSLVADITNATVPEIVALNPALLRLSTPRDMTYDLHIPAGMLQDYNDRLKQVPEQDRSSWRFHVVKPNETLEQIATDLHARSAEIAQYNQVTAANPVDEGDELVIPIAASSASSGQQRYTARRGDTLVTVADRFGVSVDDLRSWNHLSNLSTARVTPGRSLYVAEPLRLAPAFVARRGKHGRSSASRKSSRGGSRRSSRGSSRGLSGRAGHAAGRGRASSITAHKPSAHRRK